MNPTPYTFGRNMRGDLVAKTMLPFADGTRRELHIETSKRYGGGLECVAAVFTRTEPEQKKAISLLMASRRRAWADSGMRAHHFPAFTPGKTTTAVYIKDFQERRSCVAIPRAEYVFAHRVAPYIVGPEVTVEEVQS